MKHSVSSTFFPFSATPLCLVRYQTMHKGGGADSGKMLKIPNASCLEYMNTKPFHIMRNLRIEQDLKYRMLHALYI